MNSSSNAKIPEPTVARLPIYYRCLLDLKENNVPIVSSEEVSSRTGIKASQFRKDLSYFGEFGIQGLGYQVTHLMERIASILQLDKSHEVVLVGLGNLGMALARYPGFQRWGFKITRLFDSDSEKIGQFVNGIIIEDINNIPEKMSISIGVIAVPASEAQKTADSLINSGVKSILNFTGAKIRVPEGVVARNVDLTHELAILLYYHR